MSDERRRGRRHWRAVEFDGAEVLHTPRAVSTFKIRGLLERKHTAVDQGGDQTNRYRRQRAMHETEIFREIHIAWRLSSQIPRVGKIPQVRRGGGRVYLHEWELIHRLLKVGALGVCGWAEGDDVHPRAIRKTTPLFEHPLP